MTQWVGGKGSKPRPVDQQKYSDNWDRIFGKKEFEEVHAKPKDTEDDLQVLPSN